MLLLLGNLAAQDAGHLHAALAAADQARDPPALVWLRQQWLPQRAEWPAGADPLAPFTVHLDERGLRIGAPLAVPSPFVLAGEATLQGGGQLTFACRGDGREQWRVRADAPPDGIQDLLAALAVVVDGPPRTVDFATLVGHLQGPVVDGDRGRQSLLLAAMHIGLLTFAVRSDGGPLVVDGRSDGGLLLPALVLLLAERDARQRVPGDEWRWRLRAFAGRDGDRMEAARQLQRTGPAALAPLRALLYADEPTRVAAIDGLVRLRAASELPRIVAAARGDLPLATAMAAAAVTELWPVASAATRRRTRAELRRSEVLAAQLLPALAQPGAGRWRWFALLGVLAAGSGGLLLRERARRR